ncbi:hypothetical protein QNM99_24695 [Pseudomonas sp. PCH446]
MQLDKSIPDTALAFGSIETLTFRQRLFQQGNAMFQIDRNSKTLLVDQIRNAIIARIESFQWVQGGGYLLSGRWPNNWASVSSR